MSGVGDSLVSLYTCDNDDDDDDDDEDEDDYILVDFVGYSMVEAEVWQGLTSHQTHYRSCRGRVFYGSNDPTNSVKTLK